nr:AraC family transcriptional regulator [uncultured Marinifilum sp.]
MDYLFVICLAILIYFIVSTLSRNTNHLSDRIFIFWLFLVALAEVTFFLSSQNLFEDFHTVYEFACGSHVLHGTVFYFYIQSLINKSFRFQKRHLLHLIPFTIYMGYKTIVKSMGLVDCIGEGGCSHSDNIYSVVSVYMKFAITLAYVLVTYVKIWKERRNSIFCKENPCVIKWINSVGNGVLILLSLIFLIKLLSGLGVSFLIDQVMLIDIVVTIFVISFVHIYSRYAYVFAQPFNAELEQVVQRNEIEEEDNTQQFDKQYQQICDFIVLHKVYKDGDLTLRKLSSMIELPEHIISQSINRCANRSYSDFINSYRVKHFVEFIEQNAHKNETLLYLAYECGFNSKSSFNRVFKQFYDITPTEYIKSKE